MYKEYHFIIRISSRIYSYLLKAYPHTFLKDFGDEMVWLFEDYSQDKLSRYGWLALFVYWARIFPDLLITIVQENFKLNGDLDMETAKFDKQFTSTLAVFSRALRSGYSVIQALEIVSANAPEPTASVFRNVQNKLNDGISWLQALQELPTDVPSSYVKKMTTIMERQRETGGNLADMLDDLNREFYGELGDDGWAKSVELNDGYDIDKNYPIG